MFGSDSLLGFAFGDVIGLGGNKSDEFNAAVYE